MDSMINRKPEKRNDLQCWRAFSILAVLLFHIWPKITPNGFVGVDIFFIISGYFMAKLYFNRKTFDLSCFAEFYFKRVKRITPVYFIITICLIYLLSFSIHDVDSQIALKDFKWASIFATNFQDKLSNLDYFSVTSQYHFFRHCWSLAVEMQFYLIFPFIALIQTKLAHHLFLLFLIILFFGSLIFQHTRSSPIDYYENTLSRLWQFMVGIIAAQQNILEPNKHLCKLLFIFASALVFCPKLLPQGIVSFISVITVALIISFSTSKYSPFDHLPFYSGMVYLGDISYSLYLIHWPLITYTKYVTIDGKLNVFGGILAGLSSTMFAVFLHETIEKPLIKHCNSVMRLICLLIVAYSLSFCYIPSNFETKDITFSTITQRFIADVNNFSKPVELPPQWSRQNDIEFGHYIKKSHVFVGNVTKCDIQKHYFVEAGNVYTHYCEVESTLNGNLTAVVIGNSYAHNVLPVISSNQLLKKVTSLTAFGCLYVKQPKPNCQGYQNAVNEAIKKIKPDIIYFIQGYVSLKYSRLKQKALNDVLAENFKFAFEFFQQHSSVIIANHQHYRFRIPINAEFLRLKYFGYEVNMNERKRPGLTYLDKIQLNARCPKCLWINYNDFFCRNDYCTPLDPFLRLPMFMDQDHVSVIGARRAQDLLENATKIASKKITKA